MSLVIRNAREEDLPMVYYLEREYILEHEKDRLAEWENAVTKIVESLRNNLERMKIAEEEGCVAGFGHWDIFNGNPCVCSIYVRKSYRRRGMASLLMKTLEDQVRDEGHQVISLSTLVSNPAQFLFSTLGFWETGRKDGWILFEKGIKSQ